MTANIALIYYWQAAKLIKCFVIFTKYLLFNKRFLFNLRNKYFYILSAGKNLFMDTCLHVTF